MATRTWVLASIALLSTGLAAPRAALAQGAPPVGTAAHTASAGDEVTLTNGGMQGGSDPERRAFRPDRGSRWEQHDLA
jgi:hypothetical protein